MRHQSDGRGLKRGIDTRMDSIYTPQRVRKKAAVWERLRHVLAMMVWLDPRATPPWRAHHGGMSDASLARRGIGCSHSHRSLNGFPGERANTCGRGSPNRAKGRHLQARALQGRT